MGESAEQVTQILDAVGAGDARAAETLLPLVYEELRRLAAAYGWPADLTDEQILERLLALNLERADEEEKAARQVKRKASREKRADELL
jgi:alanyl-tRNA synthetase